MRRIIGWNILFYVLAVVVMICMIQHATFFYQFPPDMKLWVDVPDYLYFILGGLVLILLKAAHILETKSIILVLDNRSISYFERVLSNSEKVMSNYEKLSERLRQSDKCDHTHKVPPEDPAEDD